MTNIRDQIKEIIAVSKTCGTYKDVMLNMREFLHKRKIAAYDQTLLMPEHEIEMFYTMGMEERELRKSKEKAKRKAIKKKIKRQNRS